MARAANPSGATGARDAIADSAAVCGGENDMSIAELVYEYVQSAA
jgi:hypothetical protein